MKKSVTAALMAGGLLGVAAQPAQADGILFPYLSTQANVFSFVTIVNDAIGSTTGAEYHFSYGHKPAPVSNTRNCAHFDGDVHSTLNDMMTFHVGGTIVTSGAIGFALFEPNGDSTGTGAGQLTSTPFGLPVANQIAFLSVEHGNDDPNSAAVNLFGWAEVIDTGANLSLAYSTHNFVDGYAWYTGNRADFTNVSTGDVVLSWYPTSVVDTSWHVLNLGPITNMTPSSTSGIRRGYTASGTSGTSTNGGAYDRDEQFWSGSKTARIRCFGFLNRAALLSDGVAGQTANGGWTYLVGANAGVAPVSDADESEGSYTTAGTNYLVHKIQTALSATGLAPRQTVAREPSKAPYFNP